jgi:hypothetical protein
VLNRSGASHSSKSIPIPLLFGAWDGKESEDDFLVILFLFVHGHFSAQRLQQTTDFDYSVERENCASVNGSPGTRHFDRVADHVHSFFKTMEEFESLKGLFGPEGDADQLTFREFVCIDDEGANELLKRVANVESVQRLSLLRKQAMIQEQERGTELRTRFDCMLIFRYVR